MFTREQLAASLAGSSFRHFTEDLWRYVSGDRFKSSYIVDAICEHLQAVKDGQILRLAIACPIRHGKSLLTSVLWPAWLWVHDPSLRILSVSAGERLANRDSLRSRQLIQSPGYQQHFGHLFQLNTDQNQKSFYQNNHGGYRLALGTGSNTSGSDADVIIGDDILDYDRAKSDLERENVIDYWTGTLTQRLAIGNNKDRILLVGHRVHEEDVFNHVFQAFGNSGEWTYLVLPAEAKPDITNSFFNGIGWKDKRQEGELLNPERFPQEVLDIKKRELRHKYYCLFQQDPSPADGSQFQAGWFRHYREDETHYLCGEKRLPKDKAWRFCSMDTAFTTGSESDYTVIQVWDVVGQDMVLVHQFRRRIGGNLLVPSVQEIVKQFSPEIVIVEKESIGQFVIDQLRAADLPVKPFQAQRWGSKELRAVAAEIRLEAGRVWFPTKPWVAELERELLAFPNGRHDDQVDALSSACIVADKYCGKLEPEKTEAELKAIAEQKERERLVKIMNAGCPF